MFEINSEPKNITIQKKIANGDWLTITKMQSFKRHFCFDEVKNIFCAYSSLYNHESAIRVINEYGKTILSTYSFEFLNTISEYKLITVKYLDKITKEDLDIFYNGCNPNMKNFRDFQRFVSRNGGIRKWQPYPIGPEDNYLRCGRLYLRSGICCTIAFH